MPKTHLLGRQAQRAASYSYKRPFNSQQLTVTTRMFKTKPQPARAQTAWPYLSLSLL